MEAAKRSYEASGRLLSSIDIHCHLLLVTPPVLSLCYILRTLFDFGGLPTRNRSILRPFQCPRDCKGLEREERILLCAPLRDAAPHLPMFFSHLRNLTYPHNLIDLAFLVGDSKDNTLPLLSELLQGLQNHEDPKQRFGELSIMEKDFGQKVNQDVESRHGFAAQASRRKSMAQARNWLLSAALRPTHSWVYWRDVDVETAPFTILEDLMRHNKDVIVPSTSIANVYRALTNECQMCGDPYQIGLEENSRTI